MIFAIGFDKSAGFITGGRNGAWHRFSNTGLRHRNEARHWRAGWNRGLRPTILRSILASFVTVIPVRLLEYTVRASGADLAGSDWRCGPRGCAMQKQQRSARKKTENARGTFHF